MHHRDKGWSGERTTRRGREVEGQQPKKKPSPYQRAMAAGCRHTSCLASWLRYAGVGIGWEAWVADRTPAALAERCWHPPNQWSLTWRQRPKPPTLYPPQHIAAN